MASGSESPSGWSLSYHWETHSFPYLLSLLEAIFERTCLARVQFLPWIPLSRPSPSSHERHIQVGRWCGIFATTRLRQKSAVGAESSIRLTTPVLKFHGSEGVLTYFFRRIVTPLCPWCVQLLPIMHLF
jgi:hypothetical protein